MIPKDSGDVMLVFGKLLDLPENATGFELVAHPDSIVMVRVFCDDDSVNAINYKDHYLSVKTLEKIKKLVLKND
jgi:hypothetical protein